MIHVEIFGQPKCIQCVKAQSIVSKWRQKYPDRIRMSYMNIIKDSPTYDLDMHVLRTKLRKQPDYVPVIFVNNNLVELSQLDDAIKSSII